jgi:DNA-binding CsgD family transcriptional regulator
MHATPPGGNVPPTVTTTGVCRAHHYRPAPARRLYQKSGMFKRYGAVYTGRMRREDAAERTRRSIIRLCHAGLDSRALRSAVLQRLRAVLPFEASFFATADPATLLYTGAVRDGLPPEASPRFVANEFLQEDVNKFASLAGAGRSVATLGEATGGDWARSPRFREILAALGLGDELRAALRSGAACWGYLCLHRERTSPPFTPADVAYVGGLVPHLAEGLRLALLLGGGPGGSGSDTPGVLVLADDGTVLASTPAAEGWLAEVAEADWPPGGALPRAVRAVAARLQALEQAGAAIGESPARARLRTRSGRWLVVHAARLSGSGGPGQTAVVLEPSRPAELAPLILQAYGLTGREAEVVQLVLRGRSTEQMAADLVVSPLTVQQHLKAVFEKVGVHSRRDLAAQIFTEHYRPGFLSRAGAAGGH